MQLACPWRFRSELRLQQNQFLLRWCLALYTEISRCKPKASHCDCSAVCFFYQYLSICPFVSLLRYSKFVINSQSSCASSRYVVTILCKYHASVFELMSIPSIQRHIYCLFLPCLSLTGNGAVLGEDNGNSCHIITERKCTKSKPKILPEKKWLPTKSLLIGYQTIKINMRNIINLLCTKQQWYYIWFHCNITDLCQVGMNIKKGFNAPTNWQLKLLKIYGFLYYLISLKPLYNNYPSYNL